ncbi:protoporphyrinogen oxidase HemJ [Campylobacter hyointestinalis]|uniref:protoporphyrinogen oxidase HemJ n=1 Tax=Campylobacter hyointestinalis TaxID=198 RepID=UPI001BD534C3|nr:protoporphyrinogen oxidase HemJ [Campylobacter hyointestinalis]MBT0611399.1 protoporphyrinogen oxidase HemJ [Campylobacter hyointestinalis subsp. hyointestinalis]MDL2346248.1 protoporphyrinogen oxidase HemJ [Campylobacter hyointestinalis]MDL2347988.1 protoporphyrinogen oxidase HemJ [Campylobacter hyointestinalis]MDL2349731.1 protoporphyrinogen oxidase HemJ [Campylobacter hyointestinalis]MDM1025592.1 protoporphyrinogen oxidase HemJ [Campylobacter hyointestinalis]
MSLETYLWIKWLHYAAFISWMAMLFYQPRLFVYHAEHIQNNGFTDVVKIQESKLYNGIGWIAMGVTLLSGLAILIFAKPELMKAGYFHIKLLCVVVLIAYHFSLGCYLKQFKENRCKKSGKFFRMYNEVPTIIMFIIIYAMIVKANLI